MTTLGLVIAALLLAVGAGLIGSWLTDVRRSRRGAGERDTP